eukprot:gene4465-3260_t
MGYVGVVVHQRNDKMNKRMGVVYPSHSRTQGYSIITHNSCLPNKKDVESKHTFIEPVIPVATNTDHIVFLLQLSCPVSRGTLHISSRHCLLFLFIFFLFIIILFTFSVRYVNVPKVHRFGY